MKKRNIIFLIVAILILSTVTIAQVFTDEDKARAFRDAFTDFPELTGQPNITKISARLDDNTIRFEWEMSMLNIRDDRIEILRGDFEIPKSEKNNLILIRDTLETEVKREFEDYSKTFIPNPMVEYRSHTLWGKLVTVVLGGA